MDESEAPVCRDASGGGTFPQRHEQEKVDSNLARKSDGGEDAEPRARGRQAVRFVDLVCSPTVFSLIYSLSVSAAGTALAGL